MSISFYSGGISGNTRSWLAGNGTQTALSSIGTLNSYTIPADTLRSDDDYLIAEWFFNWVTGGGGPSNQARITLDGGQISGDAFTLAGTYRVRMWVQVARSGLDTFGFTSIVASELVASAPQVVTVNGNNVLSSGNWTDNNIPLVAEANGFSSGTVTSNFWSVSLYSK